MTLQQKLADKLDLKESGHYFYGLCPFHDDTRASFILYPDYFICKACGKQGKIETLERLLQTTPYHAKPITHSAILPRWKKWERLYGDIDNIANIAHHNVLTGNNVYYKRRKIDEFITQGMFGLLDGWATLPVFDRNGMIIDIVARAIRQPDVKYVLRPYAGDEPRPLYCPNWNRALKSDHLFVVYGMLTVWALEAIGEPAVTGITGKFSNPELLKDFQVPITVIPDYGEERVASDLVSQLGWRGRLKLIDWPDNCEDLDDVHRIYGADYVNGLVQ